MPDNDLNTDQAVTDQGLNNADAATQQDLTDQAVADQKQDVLADGTDTNKTVPYAKLKEASDARKEAEEKAAYAQRQLELLQAQQAGQQVSPVNVQPKTSMEQAMLEYGVTADELYGDVMIKVMARKDQIDNAVRQQQNTIFANQQFMATHSDVSQVVGSVNPATGAIMTNSPELAAILAKKPYLVGACTSVQATYEIVVQERKFAEFEKKQAAITEHQTRQGVENSTQPMGGSAAGGGGAGDIQDEKLMTREQVDATQARIDSGEIQ